MHRRFLPNPAPIERVPNALFEPNGDVQLKFLSYNKKLIFSTLVFPRYNGMYLYIRIYIYICFPRYVWLYM